jgi:hypothetical protein
MNALLFALLPMVALAGEREVQKKDVPAKVLEAVKAWAPAATLKHFSLEDGNYEVALADAEGTADVVVTADGTVLTEERTITQAERPAAVTKALAAGKYAKATVKSVERIVTVAKPVAPTFELNVVLGGARHELVFDSAGALTSDEAQ